MMKAMMSIVLTFLCLSLEGCIGTSPQVTYYHLSSVTPLFCQPRASPAAIPLPVGVGPVRLPDALNRPQIVTRAGADSYLVAECQRWGGSLADEFSRVLAKNLSVALGTDRVAVFPWEKHFQPRYRIVLDVHRFDGQLGKSAFLETRWTITDGEGREPLQVGRSSIEIPLSDAGYAALVKGLNQTLAIFSKELAAEIRNLESAAE